MKPTDRIILFLAEGAGLGRMPISPGTFGSLWGIAIGLALDATHCETLTRLGVWLILFVVGIPLCDRASRLRNCSDPGSVVWDEIAAFPLVYVATRISWPTLLIGFLVFRVFDIIKPWPIRQFERLPGGLGIMADDQVAAVYSAALLFLIESWWPIVT